MAESTVKEIIRQEPLYRVNADHPLKVVIELETDEGTETSRGWVEELSPGSAKVSVSPKIPFEEDVRLRIESDALDAPIVAGAKIVWALPDQESRWLLHCTIAPKISEEMFARLVAAGYIDRRQTLRTTISLRTAVQWEMQSKKSPAWLKDYTTGGFGMVCSHQPAVGDRLRLFLSQPDGTDASVPAQVLWRSKRTSGFAAGCRFLNPGDIQYLISAIQKSEQTQHARRPTARHQSTWVFAGLTVIAFIGPSVVFTTIRMLNPPIAPAVATASPSNEAFAHSEPFESGRPPDSGPVAIPLATGALEPANYETTSEPAAAEQPGGMDPSPSRFDRVAGTRPDDPPTDSPELLVPALPIVDRDRAEVAPVDTTPVAPVQGTRGDAGRRSKITRQPPTIRATRVDRGAPITAEAKTSEGIGQTDRVPATAPTLPTVVRAAPPERVPNLEEAEPEPAPIIRPTPPRDFAGSKTPLPAELVPGDHVMPTPLTALPEHSLEVFADPTDEQVRRAAAFYQRGANFYRQGQLQQAAQALSATAENDRGNPLYVYVLAMIQYKMNQVEDANRNVDKAAGLEQNRAIDNWGQAMQRYQGRARVWLEQTRAKARARRDG